MKNIKKILVAIDLSDYSRETLAYAVDLAAELKADLIIVNVINQRDIDAYNKIAEISTTFTGEDFIKMRKQERSERIQELIEECSCNDLPIKTVLRKGVPFQELIGAVEEEGADLLVMGAKGRSNLMGVLLGSTAEKAFRRSPVPVLSLRSEKQKERFPERGKTGKGTKKTEDLRR
jgi:nucleotide-binding universal stress UspA family protein